MHHRLFLATLAALATAAAPAPARAELIYGVTNPTFVGGNGSLVSFDSAAPGGLATIAPITGIVAGHTLRGIDFRPSDGLLYAISNNGAGTSAQLYTIDLATAAATAIGAGLTLAGNASGRIAIDFNPVVNVLRVVTGTGQNYRVDANTGALIAQDSNINPSPLPPGPLIAGIAYSNNVVGASQTTLYGYDFRTDVIDTIGSVNGSPLSPNTGTLVAVGSSGFFAWNSAIGMDISGATGIAYLSMDDRASPDDNSEFFTVDLSTGAMTAAGLFGVPLLDISVFPTAAPSAAPEPSSLALGVAGALVAGLGAACRRRRRASAT